MAGLFDDMLSPEVRSLLETRAGGLLGGDTGPWGTGFQRAPNEGLLTSIFGTNDPRDPRGQAMSALSLGLLRGSFADGIEGANRAFGDARERAGRDRVGQLGLLKTGLELDGMLDKRKQQRGIRDDLGRLPGLGLGALPQMDRDQSDMYGTPNIGGLPMFSQLPQQQGMPQPLQLPQPGAMNGQPDASQRASLGNNMTTRFLQQAQIYAKHGDYERADKLYEQAAKWQPEVKEVRVGMQGGKPVQVISYKDGREEVSSFGPAPKTHWMDRGDSIEAVDEYTMERRGQPFRKGMTPSDRISAGNLDVSRRRLALDESSPQYIQTDGGLIALPKRPGAGPIVGRSVTGEDGQPFRPPLKQIPPSANTAIVTNAQNLRRAQDALTLVQGGSVGTAQGDPDATGWKGYLPDAVLNRVDKAGVNARAAIGDLGSMIIHERSGAAVTAAESPRLKPFIPLATDSPEVAAQKLERFVQIYGQEADALSEIYSKEQGYRPSPVLQRSTARDEKPPQAQPLPLNPSVSNLRAGQTYQLPNGKAGKWDGLQFKVPK